MVSKKKVTISWSGGKDSAFALYKILLSNEYEVVHLHTVINEETKRVGMHGVKEELIELQSKAVGIPLVKLYLEPSETHTAYEKLTAGFYMKCKGDGISAVLFGDIFLEDLKQYREEIIRLSGLKSLYPLWQISTKTLMNDFINSGFQTLVCSANASLFGKEQLGKTIDHDFLNMFDPKVDACGENGEFHTFVFNGPVFKKPIEVTLGEVVRKDYSFKKTNDKGVVEKIETSFWFQEIFPL